MLVRFCPASGDDVPPPQAEIIKVYIIRAVREQIGMQPSLVLICGLKYKVFIGFNGAIFLIAVADLNRPLVVTRDVATMLKYR